MASLTQTAKHYPSIPDTDRAAGRLRPDRRPGTLDIMPLKRKCVSVHWEAMFTRSMFTTPDIQAQHDLLNEVSALVDAGKLRRPR